MMDHSYRIQSGHITTSGHFEDNEYRLIDVMTSYNFIMFGAVVLLDMYSCHPLLTYVYCSLLKDNILPHLTVREGIDLSDAYNNESVQKIISIK